MTNFGRPRFNMTVQHFNGRFSGEAATWSDGSITWCQLNYTKQMNLFNGEVKLADDDDDTPRSVRAFVVGTGDGTWKQLDDYNFNNYEFTETKTAVTFRRK